MNIAFFISNHGFGHIMRNIAVVAELLKNEDNQVILVTASKHMELAKQYLNTHIAAYEERFIGYDMDTDAGLVVKRGTLEIDTKATTERVSKHVELFQEKIGIAKQLFTKYAIDCVVVDIVPWALTASKTAGIKSFLMASFTWLEQYEWFLPKNLFCEYERAFHDADHVLMYELANKPTRTLYPVHSEIGFVARPFHEDDVKRIRSEHGRPIVFLALGGSNFGLNFDIDVSSLPYDFITTEGFILQGDNVFYLPVDIENTQDYVKAADFCIAKAGWSTVAELMLAGKPTALLQRPDVPEDTMIIKELEKRDEIISLRVDELKEMSELLLRMEQKKWRQTSYSNGYKEVARQIVCL